MQLVKTRLARTCVGGDAFVTVVQYNGNARVATDHLTISPTDQLTDAPSDIPNRAPTTSAWGHPCMEDESVAHETFTRPLNERLGSTFHINRDLEFGTIRETHGLALAFVRFAAQPQNRVLLLVVPHCLLYTSPSPRDQRGSRMPSSA